MFRSLLAGPGTTAMARRLLQRDALAQPARRVIVLEGDGAGLMRLGAWAAIGYARPANFRTAATQGHARGRGAPVRRADGSVAVSGSEILLNPGAGTLSERVRSAMLRPDQCHREPSFARLILSIRRRLEAVVIG